jgi:hypothetical protein
MGVYLLTLPLPRVTGGYFYLCDDDDASGQVGLASNSCDPGDAGGVGC